MIKRIFILSMVSAALILAGCEENSPLLPEAEQVVVQAYLYANEPVTDIRLTTTYAITSEDTAGAPINDAVVSLEKNGQIYRLVSTPGDSGYYHYAGNDLEVNIGDKFEIFVEYNDKAVTGETIIPPPPKNIALSTDRFVIDTSNIGGFFNDTSSVAVTWEQESENDYYFVVVKNTEATLEYIDERFGGRFNRFGSFRSAPIQDNEYLIRRFDLTYKGKHEVRVYRVNQEYADLYEFGLQDSRNLNEPKTNIKNGLGVFAGFSSVVTSFTVETK
jgi:Domain of unknown function (DUF4249)